MAKININLQEGLIDVDGSEELVKAIYEDFKQGILKRVSDEPESRKGPKKTVEKKDAKETKSEKAPRKPSKRRDAFKIVGGLDLQSLRDFYKAKNPTSGLEKNTVFVFYLQQTVGLKSGIASDHIYTCYKFVNEKVPNALRQSLIDTSSRKGWIDTRNMDDIKITTIGENLVEHDLPKPSKK